MKKIIHIEWAMFKKACTGELSPEEKVLFDQWLTSDPANLRYFRKAEKFYTSASENDLFEEYDPAAGHREFLSRIEGRKSRLKSWMALAAGVLILVALSSIIYLNVEFKKLDTSVASDILPGNAKATLTLSNGEKVFILGQDSTTNIVEKEGIIEIDSSTIVYSGESGLQEETIAMNTLEIPHGGEFHLVLSDGTEVWLNAETKLEYPVRFSGKERMVSVTGEAYFKVAENKSNPFIVKTGVSEIKVLGTAFNVSSYRNDEKQYITLSEGSVEISQVYGLTGKKFTLESDQQFAYDRSSHETSVKAVDSDIFSAWTKGSFAFEDETLQQLFIQLGRWYDIEVIYHNNESKEEKVSGTLPRFRDFGIILNMLEDVTDVSFEVKGNAILIK